LAIVTFAYHSGWRKGEILGLTWDKVDLKQGIVRLDPGETKNNEGRTLYMDEELLKEMKALHSKRRLGCPYVFHRDGKPMKDFRSIWKSLPAGLKGRLSRLQKNRCTEHGKSRSLRRSSDENLGSQNSERLRSL
jgi:integrase